MRRKWIVVRRKLFISIVAIWDVSMRIDWNGKMLYKGYGTRPAKWLLDRLENWHERKTLEYDRSLWWW